MRVMSGVRRELFGLGVIGLALFGLFGRFVMPGVFGHQRDTGAFYFPLTYWFAQELQAGPFPLWCPLIFGGYPLLADGEIGMLYPPNVVALLTLPTDLAFILVRTAHYFVAGAGTYALARVLGVGRLAAAYSGLAFALGAFTVGHLDHGNILRTAAWLPAMLCCGELALRSRGRAVCSWVAGLAICVTLAGLGLHPQILLIELVGLGLYLPLRALAIATRTRHVAACAARLSLTLGGGIGLGLAGAAMQVAPMYELGLLSSRGAGVPYQHASAGAISPFDLATLGLPLLFRADPRNVWSLFPYWETSLYIGVVGALLALVGLMRGPRRTVAPLAALAGIGLAVAMADHFPIDLHAWLWSLPGFSSMRMPARYSLVVELALAVLAGIGLDWWVREAGSRAARRTVFALAAAALVSVASAVALAAWIGADAAGSLAWARSGYLALPHDRPSLAPEHVRQGLLGALSPTNPWTLLAAGSLTAALGLLALWHRRPWRRRRWQVALVGVAGLELVLVAHAFHPTAPIDKLSEASRPMQFLSAREGLWRTFIVGRTDAAITSRPALSGVAQAYGYSSLPSVRSERYWNRVNEVDDELLDLWNTRYFVETKGTPSRVWAQDVLFDPNRPLLFGPVASPLGQESFRTTPTATDAVRVLSYVSGALDLPDGTPVATVTVSGGDAPPERVDLSLGTHAAEGAYDDSLSMAEVGRSPRHARAAVAYRWDAKDPSGRIYPRNVYVADLPLARSRTVERIEVQTMIPTGDLRLVGLALRDRASGGNGSILPSHREKYVLVFEDERTLIYENQAAMPRAFVVGDALSVDTDEWSLEHLLRRGFDPRRQVLLERDERAGPPAPSAVSPLVRAHAAIESYTPNEVVVRASTTGHGHLVLSDAFYPGWRASLDGSEAPIVRANYLFRAVALPPGEHVVRFWFEPRSVYFGGLVSLLSLLAILILLLVGVRGRSAGARRAAVLATIPFQLEYPALTPASPGQTEETARAGG